MTAIPRNFNREHPERKAGEVFIGMIVGDQIDKLLLKSKRLGKTCYTSSGALMPPINPPIFPVFVLREELEKHPFGTGLIWELHRIGLWIVRYNFNRWHPELQDGEIFLTNDTEEGYQRTNWTTKRKGEISYGSDGGEVGALADRIGPVFVQRKELETCAGGQRVLKTLLKEGII